MQDVLERTARESYGRLVAWLAVRCGDLQLAEDALSDALQAALTTWPERGIPTSPEAWLLTAARRRAIDRVRRGETRERAAEALRIEAEERQGSAFTGPLQDRRLELLFVCAHPAVPSAVRTPLMLQVVLGLTAERIGSACLVAPATMGQRLSRAKRQLKGVQDAFELPHGPALRERLPAVLEAIYSAFTTSWTAELEDDLADLGTEALWLAQLLVQGLPDEPEVLGLYALILFVGARRSAGRDDQGAYVPLEAQDPHHWALDAIEEAERALFRANRHTDGLPGPFQLEAAIQAAHCDRRHTGTTDRALVLRLYRALVDTHPSIGAYIGYAAACSAVGRPDDGLAVLDQLPRARVADHAPYWAVRGRLLQASGANEAANTALTRAAGLTGSPAVRRWLLDQAR